MVAMCPDLRDEIRQTKPFGSLEEEAFLNLGRTWAVLDHAFGEALKEHGITPTQYNVLRILRGAGEQGLCRGEVMERMLARVPDGTRMLDRMEAQDLIARTRSAEDRRFVRSTITRRGLELLEALDEPVAALHERHLGDVDADDLHALIEVLSRIRNAICT